MSAVAASVPKPPGTNRTSSFSGQSRRSVVGTMDMPESDVTGSKFFQNRCRVTGLRSLIRLRRPFDSALTARHVSGPLAVTVIQRRARL